jgi:hypothetical protein
MKTDTLYYNLYANALLEIWKSLEALSIMNPENYTEEIRQEHLKVQCLLKKHYRGIYDEHVYPLIGDWHYFTSRQEEIIHNWYRDHYLHVNKLIDNMSNKDLSYPPTEEYDKSRPEVWKAEHWNWFLNIYLSKQLNTLK